LIALRVKTEGEVDKALTARGFEKTAVSSLTGRYWKCKANGRHLEVPFSVDGFVPEWMWEEIDAKAVKVQSLPRLPRLLP
jgi:hypothetical protein